MAASEESMRLFRIRKNTMEMLKDRGYLVVDEELSMDFKQFKDKFGDSVKRDDLAICKPKKDNPSDQIFVFFPNDEKVGVPHARKAVERMTQDNVFKAILIVQQNPTPAAKAAIQDPSDIPQVSFGSFSGGGDFGQCQQAYARSEHLVLSNEEKEVVVGPVSSERNSASMNSTQ